MAELPSQTTSSLEEKVLATIKKSEMLDTGDQVLVATSGGPDSIVLLNILLRFRSLFDLRIQLFHLNHQMRADAASDASFVQRLAEKLGLPCKTLTFNVPKYVEREKVSPEDGARKIRYKLLTEVADDIKANKIALGHQADDQVETFLMRLLQGAGTEGLQGIPSRRARIIRPLIEVNRKEIIEYCWQKKLKFRRDNSNLDPKFLRNKVRLNLLPVLEECNPGFKKNILRVMDILEKDGSYLEIVAKKEFEHIAAVENSLVKLPLSKLKLLPVALQRRIIRQAIRVVKGDLRGIEFKHIDLVLETLDKGEPKLGLDVTKNLAIFMEYENLIIAKKKEALQPPSLTEIVVKVPGITELPGVGLKIEAKFKKAKDLGQPKKNNEKRLAQLDVDSIKLPLHLRFPLPGDRFRPLGMKDKKKLQDFFVDEKIPIRVRRITPLVISGGEIVWLVGLRIDDRFKITTETENALILRAKGMD